MSHKIVVVGTGYVGLVAAACFAQKYPVVCVDTDEDKVAAINCATAPFFEPGLDELLKSAMRSERISATTDIRSAMHDADFAFISVGTPSLHSGAIDLSYVQKVAEDIAEAIKDTKKFVVIVQRSTVIPATTRNLVQSIIKSVSGKRVGQDFGIAFVPEFLREGNAVNDFMHPDRIIIGADDDRTRMSLIKLYADFHSSIAEERIVSMSMESAELVKYASNAFLATKISFANEIARLAEIIPGVDVNEVMRGVGLDHRISPYFFGAGAGFGGSCFPKDIKALIHYARTHAFEPLIIEAVMERNMLQIKHIVDIVEDALGTLGDKRIALLGLSFKPNTSDMREAPSLKIIAELIERGAGTIVGCDPKAINKAKQILGDRIFFFEDAKQALNDANCAIIITEWEQFRQLTPQDFINAMRTPVVVDARRIYNADEFERELTYIAIGRGKHTKQI